MFQLAQNEHDRLRSQNVTLKRVLHLKLNVLHLLSKPKSRSCLIMYSDYVHIVLILRQYLSVCCRYNEAFV